MHAARDKPSMKSGWQETATPGFLVYVTD